MQLLGAALGLAALSGLNLYLTVFLTGLSIQQHWIDVSGTYPELMVLAHPAVLVISGVMYALQFCADKVPWIDSLWDAVHTFIRPIGGALLSLKVLGNTSPSLEIIAVLLAGSSTLLVHGAKSGTRLVINHSPEPFSNIGLSLAEDAAVFGGLALIYFHPAIAFGVFLTILALIAYLGPKLLRAARVQLWLVWRKLCSPAFGSAPSEPNTYLPDNLLLLLQNATPEKATVAWALRCVCKLGPNIPANRFGYLASTKEAPQNVWFLSSSRWRKIAVSMDTASMELLHQPKFLSENLTLLGAEKKAQYIFHFDRTQSAILPKLVTRLKGSMQSMESMTPRDPSP